MRVWSAVNNLHGQMTIDSALRLKEIPTRYAVFEEFVSVVKATRSFTCAFHTELINSRHSTLFFGPSECPDDEFTISQDEPDRGVHVQPMNGRKTLALFPTREYAQGSYVSKLRDDEDVETKLLQPPSIDDWAPVSTRKLLPVADADAQILANPHVLRAMEKTAPTVAWSDPEICALLSPLTSHVSVCLAAWKIVVMPVVVLALSALLLFPFRSALATRRCDGEATTETPSHDLKKKRKAKKKKPFPDDPVGKHPIDPTQETERSDSTPSPTATEDAASAIAEEVSRRLDEFRAPLDRMDADKALVSKTVSENTELRDAVRDAQNEAARLHTKIFEFSRAIAQFHFYFTDTNSRRRSHLDSLSDGAGYVEMDTVLGFELMASHAVTRSEMALLLAKSPVVEVAACGALVRSRHRFTT